MPQPEIKTHLQAFLYGVAVGHLHATTGRAGVVEAIEDFKASCDAGRGTRADSGNVLVPEPPRTRGHSRHPH